MLTVDIFTLAQVRRVAVMLGINPQDFSVGDLVPRGWHFALLAGETARDALRSDGFPGLGVSMPQMGLPRLLLGQRNTHFHADLRVGAAVSRRSNLASVMEKKGRNGPFAIVKIEHSLTSDNTQPDVTESQTYFLACPQSEPTPHPAPTAVTTTGAIKVVTPDDLMLFQYCALGFNTHRIHFDRDYATRVEGHPDLVVNGGLATLLATEFLQRDLGLRVKSLSARHLAPLYVNRPITIHAPDLTLPEVQVRLLDDTGTLAADLGITLDEL
jgi:3-methylfumaryl-CoA hydratase